jgi:DNA helicase-2/ATP-dependent DNA helicase PcrA
MKLNNAQQEVVDSISGNIAVIATAGSGKTTVLTKRIENMVNHNINPSSILAVTFSKKAKESISDKLSKLNIFDVNVETFHSLALKIIIHKYGNTYKVWTTQWEKEKCIQDICISLGLCNKDDIPYNEICVFITRQKINMITDNFIYSDDDPFSSDEMRSIYLKYEEFKKYKNYIEFDDFLNIANTIIDSFPEEKKYFQSKFEYILSDEFQDISMSQSLLLKKLNDTNTMIVGDPLQAIYSFRGGKSEYILNFDREYNNTKIINLNTNYRCSNNIVKTANALAEDIPDSKHRYYVKSFANNPDNTNPQYNIYSNEYEEAENIADKIIKISKIYDYKDIAILARTNAQLTKIQSIFHKKHIPFNVIGGKTLIELPEIILLLSYLKLSLYENDNQSFEYIYNKPNRWLDKKFLQEVHNNSIRKNISYYNAMMTIDRRNWRFKNGIDEIYEVINYLQNKKFHNVGEMVKYLRARLNIDGYISKGKFSDDGGYTEQIENINAFENIANQYASLNEFLIYMNNIKKELDSMSLNRVNLLTIHKSKGLEYPVVFIIGCNDNLLPHEKSNNIDDEKRLFYVAITRAEKELYLSSTTSYNSKVYYPSPFLDSIRSTIYKNKTKTKNK